MHGNSHHLSRMNHLSLYGCLSWFLLGSRGCLWILETGLKSTDYSYSLTNALGPVLHSGCRSRDKVSAPTGKKATTWRCQWSLIRRKCSRRMSSPCSYSADSSRLLSSGCLAHGNSDTSAALWSIRLVSKMVSKLFLKGHCLQLLSDWRIPLLDKVHRVPSLIGP